MFKTVLVAADNSPTAAEAVKAAIELTKMSGGTLHIVTAYKPQQLNATGLEELSKSLDSGDLADSLLADLSSRARIGGVPVEVHAETGAPSDAICAVAKRLDADLVIVGNKGMQGLRRVLGSVPNSVAHQAPCAVLIVSTT
ncbi:MAG: universal stress protein [Acidimicrobiales bacterium]